MTGLTGRTGCRIETQKLNEEVAGLFILQILPPSLFNDQRIRT